MTTGKAGKARLDVRIVAESMEPIRCSGKVLIEPSASIDDISKIDAVVVCDLFTPIDEPPHGRFLREIRWLREMHRRGALICSVCIGSLLLAEAGLLDGETCTSHWAYADLFRRHYPKVRFRPDSILNLESESKRLITAGGVTSWQDLALYLVARYCGRDEALRAAKVHLLASHEDGQLPFAAMNRQVQKDDAIIAKCQTWIATNYSFPNPVAAMTEQSGLRPRTFARRFRAATGYLPMDYVHALRIEEAKQAIETEGAGIDEISVQIGYEDPTFFRRLFKRQVGLTPAAYRRKVSSVLVRN
jgi:transcriptional regulator GlxA family with amidase domain